jgi:hypothetical protein
MRIALAILSVTLFLVAAKTHGRQLRLEREKAGYLSVVFGGSNPEFVEALWSAERWRFWPLTVALALGAVALTFRQPRLITILAVFSWAPSLSFFVTGLLSARRAQLWTQNLFWFALTLAAGAACSLVARLSRP